MNQISDEELGRGARQSASPRRRKLAPVGSERSIDVNAVCDVMVEMMADLLAAVEPSDDEVERLAELFHRKLRDAVSLRDGPVGHA